MSTTTLLMLFFLTSLWLLCLLFFSHFVNHAAPLIILFRFHISPYILLSGIILTIFAFTLPLFLHASAPFHFSLFIYPLTYLSSTFSHLHFNITQIPSHHTSFLSVITSICTYCISLSPLFQSSHPSFIPCLSCSLSPLHSPSLYSPSFLCSLFLHFPQSPSFFSAVSECLLIHRPLYLPEMLLFAFP